MYYISIYLTLQVICSHFDYCADFLINLFYNKYTIKKIY